MPVSAGLDCPGAYVTDGVSLFQVLAAGEGAVLLEDAGDPEYPVWVPVSDVVDRMRLVRRSPGPATE